MKRVFLLVCIFLSFAVLLSAGSRKEAGQGGSSNGAVRVVTTIFPPYDFVREIGGGKVNLTMLLPPGAESHSFEPSPRDIISIQNSDVFIYNGGESDAWVDRILSSIDMGNKKIIRLMDCVEVVEEEIVEGMQEEDDDHHHDEDFGPADVKDRSLAEWNGQWISIHLAMRDPSFEPYYEARSEVLELNLAETREDYVKHWRTDYPEISISGNRVTFRGNGGTISADYQARGYQVVETSSGAHRVWFNYETNTPSVPRRIIINDHGYKPRESGEEDEDGHPLHFHLKYGNESVADLVADSGWVPTYFPAGIPASIQAEVMIGHSAPAEEEEYDEHVWTSPANAKLIVRAISDVLCELDGANAPVYRDNTAAYLKKLDELDRAFRETVGRGTRKTLIFGDRFPFRYFADAYGLSYFAAFPGCSTETEASAATVAFLIDKVRQEKIPVVFHIELSNEKIADTICEETGARKRLFHAAHNVSKREFDGGATYLEVMTKNIETLREALL
jgi:zinc transport system substrate-binding protein